MDIQVLITTSTTDSTGPFNIIGNPGNVTIATGQTKSELVAGKTFTGVSELISEITITDTGVCNQAVTRSVIGAGGVTPTPTPAPDPVLYYSFLQYPGANLTVLGNDTTELLNINSSGGSAVNGNITIPTANCPYKVKVSWVTGSGNVVAYRLCDANGEIRYVDTIDAATDVDEHVLTPTPYTAYINIAAQSQVPATCPV